MAHWSVFGDVDLSVVKGLETVKHVGSSTIGIDTIYKSKGKIPEVFLRGCGVPDTMIAYIALLAGQPPAEGEWSVKQVLAHLSAAERGFHAWVANVLIGEQTPITGHLPEQFAAILASAPTAGALVDRFERDLVESRAIVASLTPEHRANKWRYRQIAQMLVAFGPHTQDHIGQIQKTVRAVQKL